MIYIVMLVLGCFTGLLAYRIGVKQNINLIASIDEKTLKKIKRKKVVASEFGFALLLVSSSCFATALLTYLFDRVGMYLGAGAILLTALNWANLQKDIEVNIARKKY